MAIVRHQCAGWLLFALASTAPAPGQNIVPNLATSAFAERAPTPADESVQQAAYAGLLTDRFAGPALPPASSSAATTYIPPQPSGAQLMTIAPGEMVYPPSECWDGPPVVCRTDSWNADVEFIVTNAHVTRANFGSWPEDEALALRLILGYEEPGGLGVRVRLWGMGQDVRAFSEDVEIQAAALDLDMYKRLLIQDTQLALGIGPGSRTLEFSQRGNGYSRFAGGGMSVFAEGSVPLACFERSELAMIGRARTTLLVGEWRDTTDQDSMGAPGPENIVPGTDDDSMSVVELAWGLEYRRRFGKRQDHDWSLGLLVEHQRWESEWMGVFMGSAVSFTGLNLRTSLTW